MADVAKSERILYTSRFEHELDEKRRVQIPARYRPPGVAEIELTLILWPDDQWNFSHIRVYPKWRWEMLAEEAMSGSGTGDMDSARLQRMIGSESNPVALDKVGRLCIPDRLAKEAGLTDATVLVGALDHFEIWNPERHQRQHQRDSVLAPTAFAKMAQPAAKTVVKPETHAS